MTPATFDQILRPLHRWVWRDANRRARKLLAFAETEADGGRDLSRAAELTRDALLRRLYLRHALDERRHAELFRQRGRAILHQLAANGPGAAGASGFQANWLAPGERGLDDLRVDKETEDSLLAFLHLSEKAAAGRFAIYHQVLAVDPETRDIFSDILRDEAFHMNYTYTQLTRVAPAKHRRRLWWARLSRLWKGYLRIASAIAGVLGGLLLLVQYFLVLPWFALLARRAARREPQGWFQPSRRPPQEALKSQY
ncbi:MAG TPA: ferritin-like domain-containing protein [Polyangia bacterium]|nr:ferritin-like domain-containing protein [Polyangia bacterium]